jgi:methyl-accepting chemotaxis protein
MDEMTQQNAALVEEASASSEAVSDRAAGLAKMMEFFNTGGVDSSSNGSTYESKPPSRAPSRSSHQSSAQFSAQDDDDEWQEF